MPLLVGFPPGVGRGQGRNSSKAEAGVLRVCGCNGHKVIAGERGCLNTSEVYTQRQDLGSQKGHAV